MRQHLYRHYDKRGNLLYVGISLNPFSRLLQHLNKSHWMHSIVTITIDRFDSRKEVKQAEREAIKSEGPEHNILMNGKKRRRRVSKKSRFGWLKWLILLGMIGAGAYYAGVDLGAVVGYVVDYSGKIKGVIFSS